MFWHSGNFQSSVASRDSNIIGKIIKFLTKNEPAKQVGAVKIG